jgi:NIMA (never in mitosis gene a)-related kinase
MSFGENSPLNEKYICKKILGVGGFGKAFLVENKENHVISVIKEIDMKEMDQKEKQYMIQEGFLLSDFKHPNIVNFKKFSFDRDYAYMEMEYADGGDLRQRIKEKIKKRESFSEGQIVAWFLEICSAIQYIHERNIIHRDLKPKNIFLTKDNHVKLGDFGISKNLDDKSEAFTQVGTLPYFSPELILGKGYDYKTDIWDLGVILYEMISLKNPFIVNNQLEMYNNIVNAIYPDFRDNNYSQDLLDLIPKILKQNPKERIEINEIIKILKNNKSSLFSSNYYDHSNSFFYENDSSYRKSNSQTNENSENNTENKTNTRDFFNDKERGSTFPIRKILSKNGDQYEGEMKGDKKEGKGVMIYKNGNKYDGYWKDDKKDGEGIFLLKSGGKYTGTFKNNVKDGKGIFIYKNGDRYEGEFKEGTKNGKGTKWYHNGNRYEGYYKNDDFDGPGTFYFHNKDKFEGEFKMGVGKGILYLADGTEKKGEWDFDEPSGTMS